MPSLEWNRMNTGRRNNGFYSRGVGLNIRLVSYFDLAKTIYIPLCNFLHFFFFSQSTVYLSVKCTTYRGILSNRIINRQIVIQASENVFVILWRNFGEKNNQHCTANNN